MIEPKRIVKSLACSSLVNDHKKCNGFAAYENGSERCMCDCHENSKQCPYCKQGMK